MSNLPKHLYWAIENQQHRSIDAIYRRKVRALARILSIPITVLNASDAPKLFDGLHLSKKKIADLHESREKQIQQELESLKAQFEKKQLTADYQIIAERPFFKAAINLVGQKEHAWMMVQSSKKTGIPNIVWQFIRHNHVPTYIAKEKEWQMPLNILVAIDPEHDSYDTEALDQKLLTIANEISQQCQAKLHVMHCYSPVVFTSEHNLQKRLEQLHREQFRDAIRPFSIDSDRAHLVTGDPVDKIKELSQSLDIDLVIMGAVSHNSIERIFIGSTTEEVVPLLASDILLVNP